MSSSRLATLCATEFPNYTVAAGAAVTRRALGGVVLFLKDPLVEDALIPGPSFSAAARSQRSTSILTLSALPCGHRPRLTESFVEEGGGHDAEHVSSRVRSQQDIGYNYVRWAASTV